MLVKAKMEGILTRKNSSRLEEKIARKAIRLYKGTDRSAASCNTRWLKLSQLRSLFKKTIFFSSAIGKFWL
jgi:hypothetical protein